MELATADQTLVMCEVLWGEPPFSSHKVRIRLRRRTSRHDPTPGIQRLEVLDAGKLRHDVGIRCTGHAEST